ncbi:MAG: dTDP-4-dehydrorhamnose reductase [Thermoanaerobaculia bacterium]
MRALITGADGQLGRELTIAAPGSVEVAALAHGELDVTRRESVTAAFERWRPTVVLNAAAYTAVDRAEEEPEAARRVNVEGAAILAHQAASVGARFVHVSTDFVFDGASSRPYRPEDPPAPIGVYGASKLEGEREVLAACPEAAVLRTSWLYSAHRRNFVLAMLARMRRGEALRVVADQVGSPTWTGTLAPAVWALAARPELSGVWHWADAGAASWYDLACATQQEASERGLLESPVDIAPIATDDYPTPARRPAYSVLDAAATRSELHLPASWWRSSLGRMLATLDA